MFGVCGNRCSRLDVHLHPEGWEELEISLPVRARKTGSFCLSSDLGKKKEEVCLWVF
jgi:hypothetical protein